MTFSLQRNQDHECSMLVGNFIKQNEDPPPAPEHGIEDRATYKCQK